MPTKPLDPLVWYLYGNREATNMGPIPILSTQLLLCLEKRRVKSGRIFMSTPNELCPAFQWGLIHRLVFSPNSWKLWGLCPDRGWGSFGAALGFSKPGCLRAQKSLWVLIGRT